MSKLDRDGGQCQVLVAKMPKITQKQLPKFSAPIQSCLISLPSSKCHVQIVTNLRIEPQKIDDEIYQINRTFIANMHGSLHLCQMNLVKNLVKHKVSKYYDRDCLEIFFLLFTSLLTTANIKNSYMLVEKHVTFLSTSFIKLKSF